MLIKRVIFGAVLLSLIFPPTWVHAIGPGDLKKKAKEAAEKLKKEKAPKDAGSSEASEAASSDGNAGDNGKVSGVSTKFDFVPGNKVILMDDFTRDELGEFPSRWKALRGNFDIVEFDGGLWLRMNGTDGLVTMKSGALPEKWTLEFDIHQKEMTGPVFTVSGLWPDSDANVWYVAIGGAGDQVNFNGPNGVYSEAKMPGGLHGKHHVALMAAGTSLKVYVDRERLVNIPEMEFKNNEQVEAIGIRLWRYGSDPLITNVRFAEGGKEKLDLLATPFVTQGIVFDTGSDRLRPESAPVLRQVSSYLKENPEVRILITGHTDDVGENAANQTLSEKRAAAVAASLAGDFGIDAARMSTAGLGESTPLSANDTPEGRATNRRVEFSKS
jgi:OmpA-OmpF porin, OOP family